MEMHAEVTCKGLTALVLESLNLTDGFPNSFALSKSFVSGYVNSDHPGLKEFILAGQIVYSNFGLFF